MSGQGAGETPGLHSGYVFVRSSSGAIEWRADRTGGGTIAAVASDKEEKYAEALEVIPLIWPSH